MNDDDEMNETGNLSQIRFLNGSDKNNLKGETGFFVSKYIYINY